MADDRGQSAHSPLFVPDDDNQEPLFRAIPKKRKQKEIWAEPDYYENLDERADGVLVAPGLQAPTLLKEMKKLIKEEDDDQKGWVMSIITPIILPLHNTDAMLGGIPQLDEKMLRVGVRQSAIDEVGLIAAHTLAMLPQLVILNKARSALTIRAMGELAKAFGKLCTQLIDGRQSLGDAWHEQLIQGRASELRRSTNERVAIKLILDYYQDQQADKDECMDVNLARLQAMIKVGKSYNMFRRLGGDLFLPFVDLRAFEQASPSCVSKIFNKLNTVLGTSITNSIMYPSPAHIKRPYAKGGKLSVGEYLAGLYSNTRL